MPNSQLKHIVAKYRWLYQLGLQGPDIFFYNIPILRHQDYRNVGSHMHEHQVSQFSTAPAPYRPDQLETAERRSCRLPLPVLLTIILPTLSAIPLSTAGSAMTLMNPRRRTTACMRLWKMSWMPSCCGNIKEKTVRIQSDGQYLFKRPGASIYFPFPGILYQ